LATVIMRPQFPPASGHASAKKDDGAWYKDALIYQLHVRTFCDSNADGVGDFPGLTKRLDYLSDLGISAIWLLPFFPSPLRDDGYDISDYTAINPKYGTLDDFKTFLAAARERKIRVIIEMVMNHTSDQPPWFQKERNSREIPNWAWDPVSKSYYWHRFFSHQPDLNYNNPAVREAMWQVMQFWLDLGVDGFRLDAVPYLVEREGTACENLPETHE